MSDDRKYRQRGYQDEPRSREPKGPSTPKPPQERAPGRLLQDPAGPKTPNLMAAHEVFRCTRCGNRLAVPVELDACCSKCGVAIHSCIQCQSFDTSERWECTQAAKLSARVAPKDERNSCTLFAARTTIERQTGTPPSNASSGPSNSAKQAFDDLFK
ncbi:MAG TPA: hypothetical protein VGH34_18770 [Vicinamibacterales bacterium]